MPWRQTPSVNNKPTGKRNLLTCWCSCGTFQFVAAAFRGEAGQIEWEQASWLEDLLRDGSGQVKDDLWLHAVKGKLIRSYISTACKTEATWKPIFRVIFVSDLQGNVAPV